MTLTDKNILLLSPEPWGKSFVSKHHYALILAQRGNKVYFSGPPDASQEEGLKDSGLHSNLQTLNYKPVIRGVNRLPGVLRNICNRINISRIQSLMTLAPDVVWSFDPYRFQNLRIFSTAVKIYHSVDVHQTPLEQQAVETADIVFSTAHKILERFNTQNTPKYFINHGLASHFLGDIEVIKNIPGRPDRTKVGYVGNMHYQHLDCDTLKTIVAENTDCDFHFIGPLKANNLSPTEINTRTIQWLKDRENVFLWGARPSQELPSILAAMDVFLMCYNGDKKVAEMANPHKILEYLSTGKPIVTHYIDEYSTKQKLVFMAQNNHALPELFRDTIDQIHSQKLEINQNIRKAFAIDNTYDAQLSKIETYLRQHQLL